MKWVPDEVEKIPHEPFSLNFVYGPCQVGKTTMVKILIHRLLEKVEPRAVFYYSCDELSNYKELGEIIDDYLKAKTAAGVKISYIFLDEVTFVEDWWRAVKARVDDGSLSTSVVTVTGSVDIELLRQRELFPGRRGKRRDVKMLPLSFGSYVSKIYGVETAKLTHLQEAVSKIEANRIYQQSIADIFDDYLQTGGFPPAIKEKHMHGRAGIESVRVFLDGFRSDLLRVGKSETSMKEVVAYLLNAKAAPVSWMSIAKATSIASPNTVRSYAEAFENMMTVVVLKFIDPSGKIHKRKNRKIHFIDPFVYRCLADFCRVEVDSATMVEGVVASHLARQHDVFYWRNGGEVDCLVKHGENM
ncbi:MAG: ATP-binding protein [Candidatus Caldarchaeum sp.]